MIPETVYDGTVLKFMHKCVTSGEVSIDDIMGYILELRKYNADSHLIIVGQNGTGKSRLLMILMKKMLGKNFLDNFRYVDMSADDFNRFLAGNHDTILGVDEWNRLLSYKKHATAEQNKVIEMIELARSHKIAIIGCIRDHDKITKNYRDGKTGIILFILDRFKDTSRGFAGYAAVLVGNQLVEGEDRFCLDRLDVSEPDMAHLRAQIEQLPSFVGYLEIPSSDGYLDDDDIRRYEERKDQALINYANESSKKKGKQSKLSDEL